MYTLNISHDSQLTLAMERFVKESSVIVAYSPEIENDDTDDSGRAEGG